MYYRSLGDRKGELRRVVVLTDMILIAAVKVQHGFPKCKLTALLQASGKLELKLTVNLDQCKLIVLGDGESKYSYSILTYQFLISRRNKKCV